MARGRSNSTAEELTELIALLPWWAGVGLGLLSYVVLHSIASAPLPVPTAAGMSQVVSGGLWRAFAYAGQFALPFICLIAAVSSAIRQRNRRHLLIQTTSSTAANALDAMSWQQFELLVGEGFRQQGYSVAETGAAGADGGVDLVLSKGGERFLVQCKQWKAFKVGVTVVRELYGVMAGRGAAGGFVVTSGRFTEEATQFADGRNIRLIDGPVLLRLIRQKSPGQAEVRTAELSERMRAADAPTVAPAEIEAAAACPVCTKPMVRRVAKRGAAAGRAFMGCSDYPDCRGTRSI